MGDTKDLLCTVADLCIPDLLTMFGQGRLPPTGSLGRSPGGVGRTLIRGNRHHDQAWRSESRPQAAPRDGTEPTGAHGLPVSRSLRSYDRERVLWCT